MRCEAFCAENISVDPDEPCPGSVDGHCFQTRAHLMESDIDLRVQRPSGNLIKYAVDEPKPVEMNEVILANVIPLRHG